LVDTHVSEAKLKPREGIQMRELDCAWGAVVFVGFTTHTGNHPHRKNALPYPSKLMHRNKISIRECNIP